MRQEPSKQRGREWKDFELSIVISRPVQEVFGFLANLENDIKWRSEWVETKNTSGGALA